MREYGQMQCSFLINPEIKPLPDQAKLLAYYLVTGPHSNALGAYFLPKGYIQADLGWSSETVSKQFNKLFEIDFAKYDETAECVFLPNFLRWNPIRNPNVGINVERCFREIPKTVNFYRELAVSLLTVSKQFQNNFKIVLETVLNTYPILSYPILTNPIINVPLLEIGGANNGDFPTLPSSDITRATFLPNKWTPSADDISWAKANGFDHYVNLNLETEEFCNYWTSLPRTSRNKRTDWSKTWRNRIIEQAKKPMARQGKPAITDKDKLVI